MNIKIWRVKHFLYDLVYLHVQHIHCDSLKSFNYRSVEGVGLIF